MTLDQRSFSGAAWIAVLVVSVASASVACNRNHVDRDGFAEGVMRPAASEWDEREETPWPVIQEAAKIGLYSFEGVAQLWADPSGLTFPIANEELFWGDAGIGMSIMGTTLAVAGIFSAGTTEQLGEWVPQCYGTVDEPQVGAFCVSEPDAGSDVSSLRTRAKYDEAKDEWVLNGQKAWATNGGIAAVHVVVASVDPELGSRGQAAITSPITQSSCVAQGCASPWSALSRPLPLSSANTTRGPVIRARATATRWR